MTGDECTRCGQPEVGAAWADLYTAFAPEVSWASDAGHDFCPSCCTPREMCLILGTLGGLRLHLAALQDPTATHADAAPLFDEINGLIDARLGDGDPR